MRTTPIPTRAAALTVTALSLAVSAIFASPGAMAASGNPAADIPAEIRFAMQRDLGMMPGQIPQFLETERLATSVERDARTRLGVNFAGAWLERDAQGRYRTVVASTRSNVVAVRGGAQSVRVVEHSLLTLDAARAKLDATARVATAIRGTKAHGVDARIQYWYVDMRRNRIVVTTDIGAGQVARDFVVASGVDTRMVAFTESAARPRHAVDFDIRGGDGINITNRGACSIGFTVTLGPHNGFVTAGHCGPTNATVTHVNGQSVGYIFESVYPGNDFAVVHNTNPEGIPRPWINLYNNQNLLVSGANPAAINAPVCRSGRRTGVRCGTLLATGASVNYGDGIVNNISLTTACTGTGDSGGSFFTPNGQAQGVTSGGLFNNGTTENCTVGTAISMFQPIGPVLARYPGLTLVTSP
jgi:alpha-lytic endopeptidase